MEDFQKYLSTAPVLLTIWMSFTAGFIIEINRFFPDMLVHHLHSYMTTIRSRPCCIRTTITAKGVCG
jgi:photosystem I subunit 9